MKKNVHRYSRPICEKKAFSVTLSWRLLCVGLAFSLASPLLNQVFAQTLSLHRAPAKLEKIVKPTKPDQLPHSTVSFGQKNIKSAWLSDPTDRYQHGVLGDDLEAGALAVETTTGAQLTLTLPQNRVFEDLIPRLIDINNDGRDEIVIVESDIHKGASLAIYGIQKGKLQKMYATPFIGRPFRWLNPVGAGDFDGDGQLEIALIVTPHIGGILRIYQLDGAKLRLLSEINGYSTHRIGTTELGLGKVIHTQPFDMLLLPNQKLNTLIALGWTPNGMVRKAEIRLPDSLISSLKPVGPNRWRFKIRNGDAYTIQYK